jgi:four helix bundle protein
MAKRVLGYRALDVWQNAMNLATEIYKICEQLPSTERFGLTDQLRRAAVSVPANIAEVYGRGAGDFRRHVQIARGSLMEIETEIELCVRVGLIEKSKIIDSWKLAQSVGKMLTKLSRSLKDA